MQVEQHIRLAPRVLKVRFVVFQLVVKVRCFQAVGFKHQPASPYTEEGKERLPIAAKDYPVFIHIPRNGGAAVRRRRFVHWVSSIIHTTRHSVPSS